MKIYKSLFFSLLVGSCLTACSDPEITEVGPENGNLPVVDGSEICQGMLKVKFSREIAGRLNLPTRAAESPFTGIEVIDSVLSGLKQARMTRLFPPAGKYEARQQKYGLDQWFRVEFDEDRNPMELAETYLAAEGVEYAGPQFRAFFQGEVNTYHPDYALGIPGAEVSGQLKAAGKFLFNDPYLPIQWDLHGQKEGCLPKSGIGIEQAWKATAGSPDVIVAVIDQGVKYTHEDLKDNMWVNTAEQDGQSGKDDDDNGYKDDIYGYNFLKGSAKIEWADHGTHVAGTIAAVNNNSLGVSGIAGGTGHKDGVRIMSCQIGDEMNNMAGMEAAFAYAANNGAVICQCSWNLSANDPAMNAAIDYFISEAGHYEGSPMKGGVAIFGAGNEGKYLKRYPSSYDPVIAVAAVDHLNSRVYYSNYSEQIDLCAPGGDGTNGETSFGIFSTIAGNSRYGYMSGTSMACPHVSGIAALVVSAHRKVTGFTNEDLKRILFKSVIPLEKPEDREYMGRGIIRADLAVWNDDREAPAAVTDLTAVIREGKVHLSWKVTADPNDGSAERYKVEFASSSSMTGAQQEIVTVGKARVGDPLFAEVEIPANGEWFFTVKGEDLWGNQSEASNQVSIKWNNTGQAPEQVSGLTVAKDGEEMVLTWKGVKDANGEAPEKYIVYCRITYGDASVEIRQLPFLISENNGMMTARMDFSAMQADLYYEFAVVAVDKYGNSLAPEGEFVPGVALGEDDIRVYPNPFREAVSLTWGKAFTGVRQVEIFDNSGRRVYTTTLSGQAGEAILSLGALAPGRYVLQFSSTGRKKSVNIIKI